MYARHWSATSVGLAAYLQAAEVGLRDANRKASERKRLIDKWEREVNSLPR